MSVAEAIGELLMGFIEENLVPGETVLFKTRLHWVVLIGPLLIALCLGSLCFAFSAAGHWGMGKNGIVLAILLLLGALVLIVSGILRKNSTEVVVSNRRILVKTGVLARKSIKVLLSKIESIEVNESAIGRVLGYGSIVIRGTGGTFERINNVAQPNKLRREVQKQIGGADDLKYEQPKTP